MERDSAFDLTKRLSSIHLHEGENVIDEIRLIAHVEEGEIVNWSATNGAGKNLTIKMVREVSGPGPIDRVEGHMQSLCLKWSW
jgi:ABC-type uncharacterized transport system ATPase subunit